MKTLYNTSLLLCLLIGFYKPAKASHVVAAEITYQCTPNSGIFEVTLVVYRDCAGTPLCPDGCGGACLMSLNIMGAEPAYASTSFGTMTLSLISVRDYDPKLSCRPWNKSTCTNMGCVTAGNFTPGYERYEFKGTVNLGTTSAIPSACCNVRLGFQQCCRGGMLENISGNGLDYYTDAVINRCHSISPCNSSPQFTQDGYDFAYSAQPFRMNYGVIDPERDSLSYEFAPSLTGYNTPATYIAPFTYNKPLPWTGPWNAPSPSGIHCDPLTGDIQFTPGGTTGSFFNGMVVILVKQWKTINGVPTVIGAMRRETKISSGLGYPNTIPFFINPNAPGSQPQYNWDVCEGEQLCFDIASRDMDTLTHDSTFLSWNASLASLGATFTPNYPGGIRGIYDSYKFCWTPPPGSASSLPYMMVVNQRDNSCPWIGRSSEAFTITVRKPLPVVNITQATDNCFKKTLAYTNQTPDRPLEYSRWRIAKVPFDSSFAGGSYVYVNTDTTPSMAFSAPGKYLVQLTLANKACSVDLFDTITVDSTQANALNHITTVVPPICLGQHNGEIHTQGTGGVPPYMYSLGTTGLFNHDSVFENLAAGTYTINIRDQLFCITTFTQTIIPPTLLTFTQQVTDASCFGVANGSAILNTSGGTPPYQYKNGFNSTYTSNSVFTQLAAGNHTFYTIDNVGCYDSSTVTVNEALPVLGSTLQSDPTCYLKQDGWIQVSVSQGQAPYLYALDSGAFGLSDSFPQLPAGEYTVRVKDNVGCLLELPTILSNPPHIVIGGMSGNTTVTQDTPETYSIIPQVGLYYYWAIEHGTILSGQETPTVTVSWDSTGWGRIGAAIYSDTTCGDTTSLWVWVQPNISIGLKETAESLGLEVYPNPTAGLLNITLKTLPQNHSLKLYDVTGRLVMEQELKQTQQLNLEDLPQGIYLLRIGDLPGKIIQR